MQATINWYLIFVPLWAPWYFFTSAMLQGRPCGRRVLWGARTAAFEPSSRLNRQNRVTVPEGQLLMKNRQRGERLSPCRIHVVWGCCSTKFGWFILARGTKNWWIHRCCDDVHGCYQFFTMPVDVLFGHITRYPHDTKIRPMSRHNLRLPPWRNIGRICIGFKLEANIWIQSGGVHQLQCSFFPFWHIAHDGCLAMHTPSQKVGVHVILYITVDSI